MKKPTPAALRRRRQIHDVTLRALEAETRRLDPTGRGISLATLSRVENGEQAIPPALLIFWSQALENLVA